MNLIGQELAQRLFIVLASASPRRSTLLREAGFRFQVFPSQVTEIQAQGRDVECVVVENARIKGRDVLQPRSGEGFQPPRRSVLLAADTLVSMGAKVYGKPGNLEEAAGFLRELGGRPHRVLTGVFLHDYDKGRERTFSEITTVTLKRMSAAEIAALFRRVTPLDKAGGYGFQDAPEIVSSIVGSKTNVIGLPMRRLFKELQLLCRSAGDSLAGGEPR